MSLFSELRLVPFSRLTNGSRWRVEAMRSYSAPQLLWITKGQGRITVGGVTRGYGAHNAVFIPAHTMHGFEMTTQVYGTAIVFSGMPDMDLPDGPHHLRIRDGAVQAELTILVESLQREIDGRRPEAKRAIRHLAGLVSVWLDRQILLEEDGPRRPDSARRLASGFAALVEKDFRSAKSVSDYAAELGVTPTHLTRVCNRTCGRTASDLLAERKISEAQRLLADTRAPIKEIASALGYASPAYFTRAFQARAGASPTTFRKGH
ncbi:AraC family transcriptional regulator [Rhodovulum sp. BSW8]|uniref:Helix-turn-helix domain-containing protein n=2 Tax=Rhodovulum visakhapatnamense TaxID=364297 RepID=A0ABS1RF14_9RHOB|nr:AraC family transcriptional regulator [Rhodovulum sp. BSW8]MBL3568736.1 helix-turn-helix domain-containing protein [Rhodovulum visakhapatnamense]MBL3577754.1 helix-turn-helix domain-containing protein [Rhodovulum visakhapatnamense]OLS44939.1 AraC family transcriptional regulator [Rhodovulum sulfidophilum]RBO54600.1 AraC family transcriptional regulator [Rhodovulum sp. BSW8]